MEVRMLTAVKFLKPVSRGVTAPYLFAADDGEIYVVKFQTNRIGPKVLVNELLASRLGERWQLCFPPGGLISFSKEVLSQDPRLAVAVVPGVHFACRFLRDCRYLNRFLLEKAVNKQEMAGVMLFDHLFHNIDRTRNPRNLLVRKEEAGGRIYAIDHSHLFYRGNWNEELLGILLGRITINNLRGYGVLLRHYLTADDFLPFFNNIKQTGDDVFADLVNGIPREWLPGAKEREILINWLCRRRDYADQILEQLCSRLPENRC
jgi:hypothetical protein